MSTGTEKDAPKTTEEADDSDSVSSDYDEDSEVIGGGFSPCGKTKKHGYICTGGIKECGSKIKSGEDCVMCDMCKKWFHPKCQGLSARAFKALCRFKDDFVWLCVGCKPNMSSIIQVSKGQKDMEKHLEAVEKSIIQAIEKTKTTSGLENGIENRMKSMENKLCQEINEKQAQLEASLNKQGSCTSDLKKLVQDKFEKEKRGKNIILHNIDESVADNPHDRAKHDKEVFKDVVKALIGEEVVEIEKVVRLGKIQEGTSSNGKGKPRLMLISVKDKEQVNMLIKQRTKLKERGFPNVYLTHDLTPEEREEQRKLRNELEEKGREGHVIFRGKVIPRRR